MAKISYRTVTLERSLAVPRADAWEALLTAIAGRSSGATLGEPVGSVTEVVLSEEPPWRRVVRLDGDHASALIQTSFTIRDDGGTCLVAWSCLIDPTGVDAGELDGMVESVRADGAAQLDHLAEVVQAGCRGS